jgi:hypothetical protein
MTGTLNLLRLAGRVSIVLSCFNMWDWYTRPGSLHKCFVMTDSNCGGV